MPAYQDVNVEDVDDDEDGQDEDEAGDDVVARLGVAEDALAVLLLKNEPQLKTELHQPLSISVSLLRFAPHKYFFPVMRS